MRSVIDGDGSLAVSRTIFEKIYADYNKRVYVSPDPLQFCCITMMTRATGKS